jgi:hypothetical protein
LGPKPDAFYAFKFDENGDIRPGWSLSKFIEMQTTGWRKTPSTPSPSA